MLITRRNLLRSATTTGAFLFAETVFAANDFWAKKAPAEWSPDEIRQLLNKSPWAKKVHGEMAGGAGGRSGGDASGGGAPEAGGRGPNLNAAAIPRGNQPPTDTNGGPTTLQLMNAPEVLIRWESAQPMILANKAKLPADLDGRYTISVTGLPPQMMLLGLTPPGRGRGREPGQAQADEAPRDPAARQKAEVEQILHETTLTGKGHDPVVADALLRTNDTQVMYLFGFPKQSLPLTPADKEVVFTMKLGALTIRAKFEPKEMMFGGRLAV